jgi:hypothetical protein
MVMLRIGNRIVRGPAGDEWRVGRVWTSRRMPSWRRVRVGGSASEAAWYAAPPDGDLEGLALWVALFIGTLVVAVILIPLLLFGVELVALGVLLALGIVARSLLGRPWLVRAVRVGGHDAELAWAVSGWGRSRRVIDEVATSLASGQRPTPAEADGAVRRVSAAAE